MFQVLFGTDSLTGIVAMTGHLYWIAMTVARLFKHKNVYMLGRGKNSLRVQDVIGDHRQSLCVKGSLSKRLISHSRLMTMLRERCDRENIKRIHDLMNGDSFYVRIVDKDKEGIFTYLTVCGENEPGSKLFFHWIIEEKNKMILTPAISIPKLPLVPDNEKRSETAPATDQPANVDPSQQHQKEPVPTPNSDSVPEPANAKPVQNGTTTQPVDVASKTPALPDLDSVSEIEKYLRAGAPACTEQVQKGSPTTSPVSSTTSPDSANEFVRYFRNSTTNPTTTQPTYTESEIRQVRQDAPSYSVSSPHYSPSSTAGTAGSSDMSCSPCQNGSTYASAPRVPPSTPETQDGYTPASPPYVPPQQQCYYTPSVQPQPPAVEYYFPRQPPPPPPPPPVYTVPQQNFEWIWLLDSMPPTHIVTYHRNSLIQMNLNI